MAREFAPSVVTANDLALGDVVYLAADGSWTRRIGEAELMTQEAQAQQRLAFAEAQSEAVIGAYLAEARSGPDGPEPARLRERFRSAGPSNRFHGKQRDLAHA